MTTDNNPNLDIFIEDMKEVFDRFEDTELDVLNSLRDVQSARHSILQHEAIRLERKLGADHLRVQEIKAKIANTPAIVAELAVEAEEAKVKVPEDDEGDGIFPRGWLSIIWGFLVGLLNFIRRVFLRKR